MLAIRQKSTTRLHVEEGWRHLCRRVQLLRVRFSRNAIRVPERLLVAPTDLRPVDSFVAEEMLEGRFPLAGRLLTTDGASPFNMELPSAAFAARLHSFGWLRHFRAVRSTAAQQKARQITDNWMSLHGRVLKGIAWEPEVVAERAIAWMSHSPVLLANADATFYHRFVKALAVHVLYMRRLAECCPPNEVRFRLRIALAMASVSMPASAKTIRKAARDLDREIDRQILGDGGHVSRNPRVMLELLLDLLPLRQTYVNLGHDVPSKLIPGIDRMYPALRFFRHQDGDLALFNGATVTLANELTAVLRYDESGGQPFRALPHMAYQRLSANGTLVIVDTGHPASIDLSRTAHAGCLAFEMSSGRNRFIVNAGAPKYAARKTRMLARATAAHSTVVLDETSSARFSQSAFLGPVMTSGVSEVSVRRKDDADGWDCLRASHDGYYVEHGLFHEREMRLSPDGLKLFGADRFMGPERSMPRTDVSIPAIARFHVHPLIDLVQAGPDAVLLRAPDGESWIFSAPGAKVAITEDIFFADASGARASEQIEVSFDVGPVPEIRWQFLRRK